MIDKPLPENDRLLDLLATRATDVLTQEEENELKILLEREDGVSASEFETAAAAIHLALNDQSDALSDDIIEKVLEDANDFFEQRVSPTVTAARGPANPRQTVVVQAGVNPREIVAWFVAAAAIAFALIRQPTEIVDRPPENEVAVLTNEDKLEELLEEPDTIELDWKALEDPTATDASGSVVWNTKKQQGYMRIANLAKNAKSEFCYQLWIFDEGQEHPIDGGVFNITADNELIPIDAKIDVSKVVQFAVTVEEPGGVVVS